MTPLVNQCQKVSGFSTILPVENVDKTVDAHVPVINERDYDRSCRRTQQTGLSYNIACTYTVYSAKLKNRHTNFLRAIDKFPLVCYNKYTQLSYNI